MSIEKKAKCRCIAAATISQKHSTTLKISCSTTFNPVGPSIRKHFYRIMWPYLQMDGYAAYEQTQANLVGCFAHARPKHINAQGAQSKGTIGKFDWALNHIQKLYAIEKRLAYKTSVLSNV
jgi:hypothetical protein